MVEVKVPEVGESISEVQIGQWMKSEGDWVDSGEDLVDIETEKASVQIPSPAAGFLRNIRLKPEEFAAVGDVIAEIEPAEKPAGQAASGSPSATPAAASPAASATTNTPAPATATGNASPGFVMPAARRMMEDSNLSSAQISGSGPGGRILKEDVIAASSARPPVPAAATSMQTTAPSIDASLVTAGRGHRGEEIKPMSMIRRTIAARLVEAQQTAALLTTFNEVDMGPVMDLRKKYKDLFVEKHGVKLGFMSFFAKAVVEALRRFPAVNAEVRGNHVVYRHYYDIGIAIGGGKGLVVPICATLNR